MENLNEKEVLETEEDLFDDYFSDVNLNKELEDFYQLILDDNLNDNFIEETKLTDIRNKNYKKYNEIDLSLIEGLSEQFDDIVSEINKIYSFIIPSKILTCELDEALEHQKILDLVYSHLEQLTKMIELELEIIEKDNDKKQQTIKNLDYSNVDRRTLEKVLNKYNDIVIYNAVFEGNTYADYKKQLKRQNALNELYKMINLEIDSSIQSETETKKLNVKISKEIANIYERLSYLEDLMHEKSQYKHEFILFKDYFNSLIAYDDNDYSETYRVYNLLCNELKIKSVLNYFEESFIEEIEKFKKEEKFIHEKQGIRNIRLSLDYISSNYLDILNEEEKNIINRLYSEINSQEYEIENLYNSLNEIVTKIWKESITLVDNYNDKEDFVFICTNNQFIEEKHTAILITKRMLERVTDYSDYQIGFVCSYDNNILYITENEDIMSVEYNDMSNLETPKQLEQEFIKFKVCNRIALNGYITKFTGVYFIDDGDTLKLKKAEELSSQYGLPLIILNKNKI